MKINTIDELEQYCLDALSVDTLKLFIWLSHLYINQTTSQTIQNVHYNIINILKKGWPDQDKTPMRIAANEWGMGSEELYQIDPCYLHQVYYADVQAKINQFFVDKIFLSCKDEQSNKNANLFLKILESCFTIDSQYTQGKNTFYIDGANYTKFKNQRWIQKANVSAACSELKILFPQFYQIGE